MHSQSHHEQEQKFYEQRKKDLRIVFQELDNDNSGTIDAQELMEYFMREN
jgi:Ca2+-binding EF-hand superfamily protein